MDALFLPGTEAGVTIALFGEGYGGSIQKGSLLSVTKKFILFDALIETPDGFGARAAIWLDDNAVTSFAERLDILRVPILGEWDLGRIVHEVKLGMESKVAESPVLMEGIVARPLEPLFDRRGYRLILKLKTKDFIGE
jgi:hypothetical protein